jgi:hypothetical protein
MNRPAGARKAEQTAGRLGAGSGEARGRRTKGTGALGGEA